MSELSCPLCWMSLVSAYIERICYVMYVCMCLCVSVCIFMHLNFFALFLFCCFCCPTNGKNMFICDILHVFVRYICIYTNIFLKTVMREQKSERTERIVLVQATTMTLLQENPIDNAIANQNVTPIQRYAGFYSFFLLPLLLLYVLPARLCLCMYNLYAFACSVKNLSIELLHLKDKRIQIYNVYPKCEKATVKVTHTHVSPIVSLRLCF